MFLTLYFLFTLHRKGRIMVKGSSSSSCSTITFVKQIKNDRLLKFLCRVSRCDKLFFFFFGWCDSPNIRIKQKQTKRDFIFLRKW